MHALVEKGCKLKDMDIFIFYSDFYILNLIPASIVLGFALKHWSP